MANYKRNDVLPIIKDTLGNSSPLDGINSALGNERRLGLSDRNITTRDQTFTDLLADFRNRYKATALQAQKIRPGEVGFFAVYDNLSLLLPINPSDISFNYPGNNETRNIITLGEINTLRSPGLVEITVESFFPRNLGDVSQVNTSNEFLPSTYYQLFFNSLYQNKEYFRFVITGYDFSELVAIQDLTWNYEYGDFENLYYTMSLKGYQPYGITLTYDGSTVNDANDNNNSNTSSSEATNPSDTTNKTIVVGSKVRCTGQLFYDSYGAKPGATFNNKSGTISIIAKGNPYPYHFVSSDSSGTGWVLESAVTLE